MNINTREYWDERFSSKDWTRKGGNTQSYNHASKFLTALEIPNEFRGRICDFGCAEGDAFPLYRKYWRHAELIGVDFSAEAVKRARKKYGSIATFECGDHTDVKPCDVIICAHTIEHMENDLEVVQHLRHKSKQLFIIVPYKENPIGKEHLRTYDEESFSDLRPCRYQILDAGWQYAGLRLLYEVYLKNLARPLFGKKMVKCPKQIIFEFGGC